MVVFELSLGVPNGKGEKGILSQQNGTHKVLEGQRVCFFIEGHRGLPQQETPPLSPLPLYKPGAISVLILQKKEQALK